MNRCLRCWPWHVVSLALAAGCSNQDAEHLTTIARQTATRAEALAGGPEGRLAVGWHAIRGSGDQPALEARVAARLRWDKALAGAAVQVRVTGGTVELRGTVRDLAQRRRAVELAQATVGVEEVADALEVLGP
jgi:osmotically-inducible protein OsmY